MFGGEASSITCYFDVMMLMLMKRLSNPDDTCILYTTLLLQHKPYHHHLILGTSTARPKAERFRATPLGVPTQASSAFGKRYKKTHAGNEILSDKEGFRQHISAIVLVGATRQGKTSHWLGTD